MKLVAEANPIRGPWLWRVKLSDKQALIAFPRSDGEIWIGFETWKFWSKNYLASAKAREIYQNIKQSKGDESINGHDLYWAIRRLQQTIIRAEKKSAKISLQTI